VSEVSKHLYIAAALILYRSVAIRADENDLLITVEGLLRANERAHVLRYIKNIQISALFHRRLNERCFHNNDLEDEDESFLNEDEKNRDSIDDLMSNEERMELSLRQLTDKVMSVLTRYKDSSLRIFA
jgi:hypothetical protein